MVLIKPTLTPPSEKKVRKTKVEGSKMERLREKHGKCKAWWREKKDFSESKEKKMKIYRRDLKRQRERGRKSGATSKTKVKDGWILRNKK